MLYNLFLFLFILIAIPTVALMKKAKIKERDLTENEYSRDIIQRFKPDNPSPTLTEMIDYHKKRSSTKYKI